VNAVIEAAFKGRLGGFALDAAFHAPLQGVTALFGPSGCGKTTILRCVAGLQRLDGRMRIGEEVWQDSTVGLFRKPHRRPVGYVFQEASLFAHLSVRRNLLFGARRTGPPDPALFDATVALLGLGHLLDRSPAALSGGERQRVAVGRALLSRPRLLLMDEPLAALDRAAKDDILPYLEAMHATLAMPVLYVSHDIAEVERLADHIVLLESGRVIASGPLAEIETDPGLPLMSASGAATTLEGEVIGIDDSYGLTTFAVTGAHLIVPGRMAGIGSRRRMRIGVSDVSFARTLPVDTSILNCVPVRILSVNPHRDEGIQVNVLAALGADGAGDRLAGRITRKSQEALDIRPGASVYAQIKSVALVAARLSVRSGNAAPASLPPHPPAAGGR